MLEPNLVYFLFFLLFKYVSFILHILDAYKLRKPNQTPIKTIQKKQKKKTQSVTKQNTIIYRVLIEEHLQMLKYLTLFLNIKKM